MPLIMQHCVCYLFNSVVPFVYLPRPTGFCKSRKARAWSLWTQLLLSSLYTTRLAQSSTVRITTINIYKSATSHTFAPYVLRQVVHTSTFPFCKLMTFWSLLVPLLLAPLSPPLLVTQSIESRLVLSRPRSVSLPPHSSLGSPPSP